MLGSEEKDIIEFPREASTVAFLPGVKDTTVRLLTLRLHSVFPATEDIKVILKKDDDVVLNADPDLELELAPDDVFKVTEYAVTIPKGSREGTLQITSNPADLRGHNYALGFTIQSISKPDINISFIRHELIVALQIRNRYDGRYTVTGTMVDLNVAEITGDFPVDVELHTMSDNSVALYNPARRDYLQPILNRGGHSVYGVFSPEMFFDANGKITGVINTWGQGAGGNSRYAVVDPTGVNTWDPATRNISVKFTMNQPDINTVRTRFDEVFTYVGPRE